jgi:hypothetical protein
MSYRLKLNSSSLAPHLANRTPREPVALPAKPDGQHAHRDKDPPNDLDHTAAVSISPPTRL